MQPYPTYQNYLNYPQQNQPMYPYGSVMQMPGITGRSVADFSEITASEIPMDGRSAIFPKNDLSEIVVKNWAADGTIRTIAFKPVLAPQTNISTTNATEADSDPFGEVLKGIQNDIRTLTDKIDKIGKPAKSRKEAEDE